VKKLGKVPVICGVAAIIAIVAAIVYFHHHKAAQSSELTLLDAEYSYLTTLRDTLQKQPNPETQGSLSVFVSANALNNVLSGGDNSVISVKKPKEVKIKLNSIRTDFRDGFPGVVAKTLVTSQNPSLSFEAELYCVIEPRVDSSNPTDLLLYFHPVYLRIGDNTQSGAVTELVSSLSTDLAEEYADTLPHLSVPLAQEFSVSFPASHIPLAIPVPAGTMNAEVDVAGLEMHPAAYISGVFFLADGIHIIVTTKPDATKPTEKVIFPYRIDKQTRTEQRGNGSTIEEKRAQINSVRAGLQNLTQPLKVPDSDFRVWISKNLFAVVADIFDKLTPADRKIHFHVLSTVGQLYRVGGGGFGCGGYAELVGGNSLSGDLDLHDASSTWSKDGETMSVAFDFSFNGQVTGHVNGTAGPHATWVLNCVNLGFARPCTNLPSTTISCDTPIGGGIGLSNYGVSGKRSDHIGANLRPHSDSSNWLSYDVSIVAPDQIPITIDVGLGQLGHVGFPINVGIPHQPLLSGKAPNIFSHSGVLVEPTSRISKSYQVDLVPTVGTVQDDGYAVVGKLSIKWQ
jgi:hypothetical protein